MDAQKMDDHLVYTTPNHILAKMDVLPKTFLQIILATKRLVRHSSMYVPQAAATTFAFSSVCFFFYASTILLNRLYILCVPLILYMKADMYRMYNIVHISQKYSIQGAWPPQASE